MCRENSGLRNFVFSGEAVAKRKQLYEEYKTYFQSLHQGEMGKRWTLCACFLKKNKL